MTLQISDLDATKVAAAETELAAFLEAQYPSLDLSSGRVLRELLIRPAAIFYVYNNANLDTVKNSLSLISAGENPENVDDTVLDNLLGSLGISRVAGAAATGQISIVISANLITSIPKNTEFTFNGIIFTPTKSFSGVTNAINVTDDSSRLITSRNDGSYVFTIDVEAVETGTAGNIPQGSRFTIDSDISGIVDAFAASGFSGGLDTESNTSLAARGAEELSPKVLSTRLSDAATLKEDYPNIIDIATMGYGDAELLRDRHNPLNIAMGGKADLYVKTREVPLVEVISKTCTVIDVTNQVVGFSLSRDEAAGVYEIRHILRSDEAVYANEVGLLDTVAGTLEITQFIRALDLTQDSTEFVPDIETMVEGAFSRYQTMVVRFVDPELDTNLNNGDTVDYNIGLLKMPNIADIQDDVNDRSKRAYTSDLLVKAPIPCICSANIKLRRKNSAAEIDTDAIKTAINQKINVRGFELGELPASLIIDAIYSVVGEDAIVVTPMRLDGKIIQPSDTITLITSSDMLEVTENLAESISSRTVAFYLDTQSIDIVVE